ncbi:4939_t:CDS:2 [Ambispora gerdemannii]|uniref:4939_t:CDS:1 n=1 Tax=Ambispora gerdemannii TaxID=144530 RepID=A0A9N9F5Z2_9GLOM|nr:4939_t:CDS:2 [Ambispora gerdemannii]
MWIYSATLNDRLIRDIKALLAEYTSKSIDAGITWEYEKKLVNNNAYNWKNHFCIDFPYFQQKEFLLIKLPSLNGQSSSGSSFTPMIQASEIV